MAYRSMFTGEPQAILEKYYPEQGSRRVIQEILKRTGLKFSQSQIQQRAAHTGIPDYLTLADLSLSPWALLCVSWGAATKPCRRPERMGDPHYA